MCGGRKKCIAINKSKHINYPFVTAWMNSYISLYSSLASRFSQWLGISIQLLESFDWLPCYRSSETERGKKIQKQSNKQWTHANKYYSNKMEMIAILKSGREKSVGNTRRQFTHEPPKGNAHILWINYINPSYKHTLKRVHKSVECCSNERRNQNRNKTHTQKISGMVRPLVCILFSTDGTEGEPHCCLPYFWPCILFNMLVLFLM